ncbi:ABC transporter ATP-binding protein [Aquibium carbonis]|uniref:ABC transporter ATP-binding protein n=1 Tax=Aquibium carbonis TaxID=2495581 RepID=A0A429YUU8_9HYPH|nr:ABC transporter ATP-binding protein [Aquibium carbonis]
MSARRRRQFVLVLVLMLVGAVGELVSIGAVLPFLAVISDPEGAVRHAHVQGLLQALGLDTPARIAIAAALLFAIAALGAAAARLVLVYVSQRFVFGLARDLSVAIFSRTLHQPYSYHTGQNSSETLAAINKAQLVTGQILMPLMQAASASVIAVFILVGLLFIDPLVALGSGLGFSVIYLLVMRTTRAVMRANGEIIARSQGERLQAAGEGLGGIRDVLLDRSQAVFVARFEETEARLRAAQATNNFIAQAPRFVVEGLGLALIAALTLVLTLRDGGLVAALPVLGALALGAQRLVPLLQQAYSGWAATLTAGAMLGDILDILRLPDAPQFAAPRNGERLPFERDLVFSAVGFSYPQGGRPAVEGVDLVVPRGARVGLAGRTGSGKSTLMDLVLGLLSPDSGHIRVDGVDLTDANRSAWQARIAHVPQSIYLSDSTLAENIAFGVPAGQIDRARVAAAAAQAELAEVIEALPQGYDTPVGERGVRLSGGQRQRVGIARALYKRADVLVFDEATSALDTETESAVMGAIERLGRDLTIFIIAHRLSTLDGCDMVVTLEAGRVQSVARPDGNRKAAS